ncbi:carbonyl reductase [NADPH] 1 [Neophocaena asiaeorientalis asiaeorientalis]|uniref:Carbonyl reductase [NADPH] 1 n=1 Tax=Neophocaena asiaeorientalis asiaeorientalis TaxID=1706337 RepID=A0A341CHQ2_NEOAA|nr:carbonyl reductase [NADPH] 1 [Neophocaena asiaeorientalis asiaeorientalis]
MALLYVPCTAGRAPAIPALKGRSLRLRLRAHPGRSGRGTFRCALCKLQLLRRHSDAPRRWESTTGSALHPRAPHTQHPAMSSCARVALVTGANKGIGFAIVRDLCRQFPGDVVLTARNTARGQAAVQQLQAEGLSPRFHQLDIDDLQSIRALRDFLLKEYGGLDVLVNNAGIAFKTIDSTPFHIQAEVTMKTNFFGTQDVCTELLPLIKPRGRVVNVSSFVSVSSLKKCSPELQQKFRSETITEEELVGLMNKFVEDTKNGVHRKEGWPETAYGVTKIGVTVLSRIQARKLSEQRGGDKILLNACCPGWVRTDMAGPTATKSPEEGAETPVYLALLPSDAEGPHGQFVSEKKVVQW